MRSIVSQKQAQAARKISFCYLCGLSIEPKDKNRDHVVASKLFLTEDRDFPLILPSHLCCNTAESENDEVIGQLIRFLHSESKPYHKLQLIHFNPHRENEMGAVTGLNLKPIILRWVRGFHAALYGDFLPSYVQYSILPPIPELVEENNSVRVIDPRPEHYNFCEKLHRNRLVRNIDSIVCYNGKLRYECVWDKGASGEPICIFALKLYDWETLRDELPGPARNCIGIYIACRTPQDASMTTTLSLEISSVGVDPFQDITTRN